MTSSGPSKIRTHVKGVNEGGSERRRDVEYGRRPMRQVIIRAARARSNVAHARELARVLSGHRGVHDIRVDCASGALTVGYETSEISAREIRRLLERADLLDHRWPRSEPGWVGRLPLVVRATLGVLHAL